MANPNFVRGQTPYWEYPCGCAASALELRLCPLHAAAPALLEALEEANKTLQAADILYAKGPSMSDRVEIIGWIREAREKNRAAIRAAKEDK